MSPDGGRYGIAIKQLYHTAITSYLFPSHNDHGSRLEAYDVGQILASLINVTQLQMNGWTMR